jgi:hypothetical protein
MNKPYHQQVDESPLHYQHNEKPTTHEDDTTDYLLVFHGCSMVTKIPIDRGQHLVPNFQTQQELQHAAGALAKEGRDLSASQVLQATQAEADPKSIPAPPEPPKDRVIKEGCYVHFLVLLAIAIAALASCTTAYKPKTFKTHCNVKMVSA